MCVMCVRCDGRGRETWIAVWPRGGLRSDTVSWWHRRRDKSQGVSLSLEPPVGLGHSLPSRQRERKRSCSSSTILQYM